MYARRPIKRPVKTQVSPATGATGQALVKRTAGPDRCGVDPCRGTTGATYIRISFDAKVFGFQIVRDSDICRCNVPPADRGLMKAVILSAPFFAVAIGNWWVSRGSPAESWLHVSVLLLLIGIGLLGNRKWTEAAIFGAGIFSATAWASIIALQIWDGDWPYPSLLETGIALVPGLAYLLFWFSMWRLVRSHFAKSSSIEARG